MISETEFMVSGSSLVCDIFECNFKDLLVIAFIFCSRYVCIPSICLYVSIKCVCSALVYASINTK